MMVTVPARNDAVLHGDQCRPLWDSRLAARTYPPPKAMSTATAIRLNQSVCHPLIRVWSWTGGEMAPANNIGPSLSGHRAGPSFRPIRPAREPWAPRGEVRRGREVSEE